MKNAMRGLEAEAGEVWAYRARRDDALTPVTVVRRDSETRPERVVIRHGVDASSGEQEWVSPNWLKVPWGEVESFVAEEERRKAFRQLGPEYFDYGPRWESPEAKAVDALLDRLVDADVASLGSEYPCLRIEAVDRLSRVAGIASNELTGHDLTFVDAEVTVAPWPVALRVAKALAKRHPDRVILQVQEEERDLRRLLANVGSRSERGSEERSLDIRLDDERGERQSRDLRREWVGVEACQDLEEIAALRSAIRRVTVAARAAVGALTRAGCQAEAAELREALDGDEGAAA
ncbi:hypothetical protein [Brachybacterium subflavum]|uniref:hypothetical protein n=1 Tax=Brachybacterium subflavum TaxID=2585206 RepID=UPI0012663EF9|nr:hypothetical protein [Brachybacterium subflavum]